MAFLNTASFQFNEPPIRDKWLAIDSVLVVLQYSPDVEHVPAYVNDANLNLQNRT
jgi:hypothetical protein